MNLALLSLALCLAPPSKSTGTNTSVKRGSNVASVKFDGQRYDVSIRTGRAKSSSTVELGSTCDAGVLSTVLAREVAENGGVFRRLPSGAKVKVVTSPKAVRTLERGLAEILDTGKRSRARAAGSTAFEGFALKVGRLPAAGKTKTVEHAKGSEGATTTIAGLAEGGAKIVREATRGTGVRDKTVVTILGDGSVSVVRTLGFGSRGDLVQITHSSDFAGGGSRTGGFAKVHTGGGFVFENDQSSGGGGGGGGGGETPSGGGGGSGDDDQNESGKNQSQAGAGAVGDTPSGGEGGSGNDENNENENDQTSGGAPTLTSGTLNVPGISVGHGTVAGAINWNRLGAAVSMPDPTGGEDTGVSGGSGGPGPGGPCTHLQGGSFNPDPKFLRPNEQGWFTDPVPALRNPDR